MSNSIKYPFLFFIIAGLLLGLVYSESIHFQFNHLDDFEQVVDNKNIRSLDFKHLKAIFSSSSVGMYQPITTLIYALIYRVFELNPFGYHLASLFFHLFNSLIVFLLLKKFKINLLLRCLLVGIFLFHPLQVESIVWVSAFSNLVFTAFFLLALLFYFKFNANHQRKHYLISLAFFILSCLSKSSAVVFPVLIMAIDLLQKKSLNAKNLLTKIPFFFVSLLIGIITLKTREAVGHLSDLSVVFSPFERIFISSYAFLFYPFKFLVPVSLSAFYPFPDFSDARLPFYYYLSLPAIIFIGFLVFKKKDALINLGLVFYGIGILPVIQLIPLGNQLATDRYSYLPMIGFLILLARVLQNKVWKKAFMASLFLFPLLFSFMSHKRAAVWENDQSIWSDVLAKYPNVAQAHNNLGSSLMEEGKLTEAFTHFNQAVKLKPYYADAYANLGNLSALKGNSQQAIEHYSKAIELKPHANAYFNRANEYTKTKAFQEALNDYSKSILLKSGADAYTNRAYVYMQIQANKKAHEDLQSALKIDPYFHQAHYMQGILFHQEKNIQAACRSFEKAMRLGNKNATLAFKKACSQGKI